jgi:hypothetical protein
MLLKNGFCGVQMDVRAFDSPDSYLPLVDQYTKNFGTTPVISENGYWLFWSLPR